MGEAMRKGSYTALASVLVAGVFASGCGGSGSSDPLTKAEFVEQANSICRDAATERSEELRDAADGDPGLAELATAALTPTQEMLEELGELSPPAGDAAKVAAILKAFKAGVAEVEADPTDPTVAMAAFPEASSLAEGYGLTDCAI